LPITADAAGRTAGFGSTFLQATAGRQHPRGVLAVVQEEGAFSSRKIRNWEEED